METIDQHCEGCAMGKQYRQLSTKKTGNNTNQMLEVTHGEICGHMNADLVRNLRYFVSFIDDYSQFITVYMIKQKLEAFTKFKEFLNLVENQTRLKFKRFRYNN